MCLKMLLDLRKIYTGTGTASEAAPLQADLSLPAHYTRLSHAFCLRPNTMSPHTVQTHQAFLKHSSANVMPLVNAHDTHLLDKGKSLALGSKAQASCYVC